MSILAAAKAQMAAQRKHHVQHHHKLVIKHAKAPGRTLKVRLRQPRTRI